MRIGQEKLIITGLLITFSSKAWFQYKQVTKNVK